MITGYCVNGEAVALSTAEPPSALRPDLVWIDLVEPTKAEDLMIESLLGIPIPTRDELRDIEPSSRLYTDDGAVFMTASLVYRSDTEMPGLTDVGFILAGKRLVTVRYAEPRAFGLFKASVHRISGGCRNGAVILTRLLETIVDRTAEILEQAVDKIDDLALQVFGDKASTRRRPPHFLEARLRDVAGHHRLVAKTRDSLASLSRLLSFVYTVSDVQATRKAANSAALFRATYSRFRSIRPSSRETSPSCLMLRSALSMSSRTPSSRSSRSRPSFCCRRRWWRRFTG